jgi:type I restriction enzyme S subunit
MKKAPWTTIKLEEVSGDVGIFVDGDWVESKDQDPKGNTRLTQLADIGVGEFLDRSSRFLTSEKAKELKCTFLKEGDILVARMPDPIGRACIFPGDKHPCVTVVDVCIIRPNPREICNRWLMWMINSPQFKRQLDQYISGTTRQRISRKNLQKLKIPLPPLEEQRRIAAILDKADGVRRKRKEAIRLTEELLKSTFLEMFGDPVTNPKGWEICELQNVCNRVTDGTHQPPNWADEGIPFLFVSNIVNGEIDFKVSKHITEESWFELTSRCPIEINDILYTTVGSYGNAALVRTKNRFCFQRHIAHIKPDSRSIEPEFLLGMMQSDWIRQQADKQARGVAQKTLNLRELKKFTIFTPPIEEQKKYVKLRQGVEKQLSYYRSALEQSENLFNSLLQRAFRGEL